MKFELETSKTLNISTQFMLRYLEVKEFLNFYNSIRRVTIKRTYFEVCEELLGRFVDLVYQSTEYQAMLDDLLINNTKLKGRKKSGNIFAQLESLDSEGFHLLGLADAHQDFNIDHLKDRYKKASKKHHPDLGGNNDVMKIINNSFSLFHEYLLKGIHEKSSEVQDDDLEVDLGDKFLSEGLMLEVFLTLLSLKNEINAFDEVDELVATIKKRGLNKPKMLKCAEIKYPLVRELLSPSTKLRKFNFKAVPCIENAFRLGGIDELRFLKGCDYFHNKIYQDSERDKLFKNFYKSRSPLSFDLKFNVLSSEMKFVPYPGYFESRFQHLTESQKQEYLQAFTTEASFNLVEKYKFVRIASLISNSIHYPSKKTLANAVEELEFLTTYGDDPGGEYGRAIRFLKALKGLEHQTYIDKANLLKELDDLEFKKSDGISISISINVVFDNDSPKVSIENENGYPNLFTIDGWNSSFEFMSKSLSELQKLAKSKKR